MSEVRTLNRFSNIEKMISLCEPVYEKMEQAGLINVTGKYIGRDIIRTKDGKELMNMSSCCYLGINDHPRVKQGLHDGIEEAGGVMQLVNAGFRIRLSLQDEVAEEFSDFFKAHVWLTLNCGMAALGTLPMLAAGIFTDGERPIMVFDKHAHFCMNYMKSNCYDETEVITINHNDFDELEVLCKKHKKVAYIGESVYSTGGTTDLNELIRLQDKYGLFIYIDEAHGISINGQNGRGMYLGSGREINRNTMIISSLSKGFGANGGGMVICSDRNWVELIKKYGGPMLWCAPLGSALWGGARAALSLHKDGTVDQLQKELRRKVCLFDDAVGIKRDEDYSAVRVVKIGEEEKLFEVGRFLMKNGFYTSTVTFPTVSRSDSGLRIMIRTNMKDEEILEFAKLLNTNKNN